MNEAPLRSIGSQGKAQAFLSLPLENSGNEAAIP
jgi:hypothetical protein